MVEVNLTFDELEMVLSWHNLLFGPYESKKSKLRRVMKPNPDDLHLSMKLQFMRIEMMKNWREDEYRGLDGDYD